MRRDGMTRPARRWLARRRVAQGKDEIELWRIEGAEVAHMTRRMSRRGEPRVFQQFDGQWINAARRMHARAECLDLAVPHGIRDGLGHHAARGISLGEKQHTKCLFSHDLAPLPISPPVWRV